MDIPESRYAKTADGAHIAYQVIGSGPLDLVFVTGVGGSIEFGWEVPPYAHVLRRLASFSRLITFDWRGLGGMHVSEDLFIVEPVDESGRPVPTGR